MVPKDRGDDPLFGFVDVFPCPFVWVVGSHADVELHRDYTRGAEHSQTAVTDPGYWAWSTFTLLSIVQPLPHEVVYHASSVIYKASCDVMLLLEMVYAVVQPICYQW